MTTTLLEQLQAELPIQLGSYDVGREDAGLAIVNPIGALCASAPEGRIGRMVAHCDALARRFLERRSPVLALVDADASVMPGSGCGPGAAELVAELAWLRNEPDVTLLRKDCVDGFVGGIEPIYHGTHGTSRNRVVDWVNAHRLRALLVTGLRSDLGVMDFVLAVLSARRHGLMTTLADIVVLEPATASHDGRAHHMALYFMAARGAVLAGELTGV